MSSEQGWSAGCRRQGRSGRGHRNSWEGPTRDSAAVSLQLSTEGRERAVLSAQLYPVQPGLPHAMAGLASSLQMPSLPREPRVPQTNPFPGPCTAPQRRKGFCECCQKSFEELHEVSLISLAPEQHLGDWSPPSTQVGSPAPPAPTASAGR